MTAELVSTKATHEENVKTQLELARISTQQVFFLPALDSLKAQLDKMWQLHREERPYLPNHEVSLHMLETAPKVQEAFRAFTPHNKDKGVYFFDFYRKGYIKQIDQFKEIIAELNRININPLYYWHIVEEAQFCIEKFDSYNNSYRCDEAAEHGGIEQLRPRLALERPQVK